MQEGIILGIIQGITEWLPVSSEGILVLVQTNFLDMELAEAVRFALFLHLGTFFAALLYLRKDVVNVFKQERRNVLVFLLVATIISGVLGYVLLLALENIQDFVGKGINALIGALLIATALLQLKRKTGGYKSDKDVSFFDGILLGIVQGLAALPGLSRSGLTVGILLLRKFDDMHALRLSFLMSLPVVLGANIVLRIEDFAISQEMLVAAAFSFAFGLLTIHLLLSLAKKINFGYFVFIFGLLTIASTFI
ncbi:undecaprenyl-diphosphate phosphatase [Patescibacteria group bacterium]|nr:undecaprenyl-diphosphate phosphatase [Patescibacteria group bacterium]